MRLYEFASAEEQLALLRLIIDNTWSAISKQAEQERRAKEVKKAKAALKPKGKNGAKRAKSMPIVSVPTPVNKSKQRTTLTKPPTNSQQVSVQPKTNLPLKPANPMPKSTNLVTNPQQQALTKPTPFVPNSQPANASFGSKDGGFAKNNSNLKNAADGDDRYSKNGIGTLKKLPRSF